ncbi:hypothetical protein B0H14DRAFT_2561546 [Mycena olivaceomarginata]|nr:hypothetical protein B0H14DRAFT_2561546 [Mycena olivaceomarginata]
MHGTSRTLGLIVPKCRGAFDRCRMLQRPDVTQLLTGQNGQKLGIWDPELGLKNHKKGFVKLLNVISADGSELWARALYFVPILKNLSCPLSVGRRLQRSRAIEASKGQSPDPAGWNLSLRRIPELKPVEVECDAV